MNTQNTEKEFQDLTLEERIQSVNNRLDLSTERIQTVTELASLEGQTIFLFLSPLGDAKGNSNNPDDIGDVANAFYFEWKVGSVEDHRGNVITPDSVITIDNNEKYLCYHYDEDRKDQVIACKDFNIVPNCYNNHAAFRSMDDMKQYMTYRKMRYEVDTNISKIDPHEFPFWLTRAEIEELRKIEEEYENQQAEA